MWTAKPGPTEIPPRSSELRAVWKIDQAATLNRAVPAAERPQPIVAPDLECSLVPGGSVVTTRDLMVGEKGVYPFPTLETFYGSPGGSGVVVRAGSLLMYAGTIRSTERRWVSEANRYVNLQVHKHTFITPYGRCIIHDFQFLRPV